MRILPVFSIGKRLKKLRIAKGLRQSDLATELKFTTQTISNYEKDERAVNLETLVSIARYFEVTTDYLLGLSKAEKPPSRMRKADYLLSDGAAINMAKGKYKNEVMNLFLESDYFEPLLLALQEYLYPYMSTEHKDSSSRQNASVSFNGKSGVISVLPKIDMSFIADRVHLDDIRNIIENMAISMKRQAKKSAKKSHY